jgi:hypothetical protein
MENTSKKPVSNKEARENLKLQLAEYLAQQPGSTQTVHKVMNGLEVAGVVIIITAFIVALVLSFAWKSINPMMIPIAWFAFAASASLTMILLGLDAIVLRAFPPILWPGKPSRFTTGSGATWRGWAFMAGGLAAVALWGLFAYAIWTQNWTMLRPLINILGIGMTIAVLYSILMKFAKAR